MNLFEGLARLFRFDVLSANWRYVLASFEPVTIALGIAAAPLVIDLVHKKLKEAGWVS